MSPRSLCVLILVTSACAESGADARHPESSVHVEVDEMSYVLTAAGSRILPSGLSVELSTEADACRPPNPALGETVLLVTWVLPGGSAGRRVWGEEGVQAGVTRVKRDDSRRLQTEAFIPDAGEIEFAFVDGSLEGAMRLSAARFDAGGSFEASSCER